MIDLEQFGNELANSAEKCQASVVYRDGDIWHKLYITPNTQNMTMQVYSKSKILEKMHQLDILKDVIVDYCVIGNDRGVYIKLNHIESKIETFSKQHLSMYDNFECFALDYFKKHFYHTMQSAPLRFNDFTDTNIFLQDDMTWRNIDIEDYFNTRYFPKAEYFAQRTWAHFSALFINDEDISIARQVFDTFYNEKRLNTVEQHYKKMTENW